MTAVTYTALRSLAPGHVSGISYSMNINCQAIQLSREPRVEKPESLSGIRESLRYGAVERYAVLTAPLAGDQFLALKEFLDSCEAAESFTFDAYGYMGHPLAPLQAEIEDGGYSVQTFTPLGQGGSTDYFVVSFTVRVRVP